MTGYIAVLYRKKDNKKIGEVRGPTKWLATLRGYRYVLDYYKARDGTMIKKSENMYMIYPTRGAYVKLILKKQTKKAKRKTKRKKNGKKKKN